MNEETGIIPKIKKYNKNLVFCVYFFVFLSFITKKIIS
jgi:hypothetical protein